ncbi:MAG: glutamate-1-semialdehyde 2,1-aminomutase [candidate division WOR-3 bacterium]
MKNSKELYKKAKEFMPGGVSSPVRAFKSVELTPIFVKKGKGPYIYSVDGKKYIDFILSWGPLILGHSHPEVVKEIIKEVKNGFSFGLSTEKEILLAQKIKKFFPFIEKIRFVNSGTEATMSAIRVARAYTKRNKIIKFEGCYHGHSDFLLVKGGSGLLTHGIPSSSGIPENIVKDTISLPYNDIEKVKEVFEKEGEKIACVIVEPVAGNMGVVLPKEGFLEGLREIIKRYDSLLIFDEIITGFRVGLGGVSTEKGIIPDLITLGKVIGGGFPVGAYGGKKEIMEMISPEGPVYQAGTLSGNPVSLTAGIKTIEILERENPYEKMKKNLDYFLYEIKDIFKEKGIAVSTPATATFFSIFFSEKEPENLEEVNKTDKEIFIKIYKKLFERGILFPPSPFEAIFLSIYHDKNLLGKVLEIIRNVIKKLK